jgi:ferredoxin
LVKREERRKKEMIWIDVNADRCVGCRLCVLICPENVLGMVGEYVAAALNPDKCNLCMDCVKECTENAIQISQVELASSVA